MKNVIAVLQSDFSHNDAEEGRVMRATNSTKNGYIFWNYLNWNLF